MDDRIVVEIKSVEKLAPFHYKQVLTYLRLLDLPVGLLFNFRCATMKEGIHRIVNGYVAGATSPLDVNRFSRDTTPSASIDFD